MKSQEIEGKLRHAVYLTERTIPPGIGLLLIGAVQDGKGGFALHQVANVSPESVKTMLVAALHDIEAGQFEIKGMS